MFSLKSIFSKKPRYPLGAFKSPEDPRNISASSFQDDVQIPKYYKTIMPPVEDQGADQKCVGEAVHKAVELSFLKEGIEVDLSPDDLYEQCKQNDGIPNLQGTYPSVGAHIAYSQGIATVEAYNTKNPAIIAQSRAQHKSGGYAFVQNSFSKICQAIYQNLAVICSVAVDNNWFRGFITKVFRMLGRHCIILHGYDIENGLLFGQNSWGIGWIGYIAGRVNRSVQPGHFEMLYDDVKDTIADIIIITKVPQHLIDEASMKTHPDVQGGDQKAFTSIVNARDILTGKKVASEVPVKQEPSTKEEMQQMVKQTVNEVKNRPGETGVMPMINGDKKQQMTANDKSTKTQVSSLSEGESQLIQEARKYKSAEEFIGSKSIEKNVSDIQDSYDPIDEKERQVINQMASDLKKGAKFPPIVVDESGNIIDGLHRIEAYRQAGIEKIPTITEKQKKELSDIYNKAIGDKNIDAFNIKKDNKQYDKNGRKIKGTEGNVQKNSPGTEYTREISRTKMGFDDQGGQIQTGWISRYSTENGRDAEHVARLAWDIVEGRISKVDEHTGAFLKQLDFPKYLFKIFLIYSMNEKEISQRYQSLAVRKDPSIA